MMGCASDLLAAFKASVGGQYTGKYNKQRVNYASTQALGPDSLRRGLFFCKVAAPVLRGKREVDGLQHLRGALLSCA